METPKLILSVLCAQHEIWGSWGPHNITTINNAVVFQVQGLKFKGIVRVGYNSALDLFDATFMTIDPDTKKATIHAHKPMLYLDMLVRVIDRYVEHTGATYDTDRKKAVAGYFKSDCNSRLN